MATLSRRPELLEKALAPKSNDAAAVRSDMVLKGLFGSRIPGSRRRVRVQGRGAHERAVARRHGGRARGSGPICQEESTRRGRKRFPVQYGGLQQGRLASDALPYEPQSLG